MALVAGSGSGKAIDSRSASRQFPFYATTCPRWRSRSTRSSDEVHVERFGSSDDKSPRAPPVELEP